MHYIHSNLSPTKTMSSVPSRWNDMTALLEFRPNAAFTGARCQMSLQVPIKTSTAKCRCSKSKAEHASGGKTFSTARMLCYKLLLLMHVHVQNGYGCFVCNVVLLGGYHRALFKAVILQTFWCNR